MRQSPISSRNRSTTTVRSSGTTPVAARCSSRYVTRLPAAQLVETGRRAQPLDAPASGVAAAQLAHERADRAAELDRPPGLVAVPERHLRRARRAPA